MVKIYYELQKLYLWLAYGRGHILLRMVLI